MCDLAHSLYSDRWPELFFGFGQINVRFLRDLRSPVLLPSLAIHRLVPEQFTALALARFNARVFGLELVDELGGIRLVKGAVKNVHGNNLVAAF
jgi:hypothetical protein